MLLLDAVERLLVVLASIRRAAEDDQFERFEIHGPSLREGRRPEQLGGWIAADVRARPGLIPDDAGGGRAALLTHRSQSENREKTVNDVHNTFRRQGLVRPREGRVLGGVIAGLGRRFGIDPWPARLLFTLILLVIPGSQLLIYPVLWILMPNEESAEAAVVTAQPQPPAVELRVSSETRRAADCLSIVDAWFSTRACCNGRGTRRLDWPMRNTRRR